MAAQPNAGTKRRRGWLAAISAVLGITGAVAVVLAVTAQLPSPPAGPELATPPQSAVTSPVLTPTAAATPRSTPRTSTVLALPRSEPVHIAIPKLNAASALEQLELDDDGAMQIPRDPAKAGWFSPSPAPGMIGSSVIAGHVTWNQRPSIFFGLAQLAPGDQVEIRRRDGVTAIFTVDRLGRFPKNRFPTDQVYGGSDQAALHLITCGGQYDAKNNRYLDNVIVWAHLTGTKTA